MILVGKAGVQSQVFNSHSAQQPSSDAVHPNNELGETCLVKLLHLHVASPVSLQSSDVSPVEKLCDLINDMLDTCSVRSLVSVLVEILHSLDGGANFHIDVTLIFLQQCAIVRNY